MILLSLSRTAFAAALIIVCLAWLNPKISLWMVATGRRGQRRDWSRVLRSPAHRPLHDRIYTGDVRSVGGGVSINLEGRSQIWATTWHSYLTSPVFGHGVGTADSLITRVYSKAVGHPHNDYLRLLHDYGLLGLCLWVAGYAWVMSRSWRAWHRPPDRHGSRLPALERRASDSRRGVSLTRRRGSGNDHRQRDRLHVRYGTCRCSDRTFARTRRAVGERAGAVPAGPMAVSEWCRSGGHLAQSEATNQKVDPLHEPASRQARTRLKPSRFHRNATPVEGKQAPPSPATQQAFVISCSDLD